MKTIYLDHNVNSSVGGISAAKGAVRQRNYATDLRRCGYRFALSAWNMYELARSNDIKHIEQCCDFVDELNPVWVNNSYSVKAQEIDRTWYNTQHRHSGIGMMTPENVHTGRAEEVRQQRQTTLSAAFQRNPNRFKSRLPQPHKLPTAAWINPPTGEKNTA